MEHLDMLFDPVTLLHMSYKPLKRTEVLIGNTHTNTGTYRNKYRTHKIYRSKPTQGCDTHKESTAVYLSSALCCLTPSAFKIVLQVHISDKTDTELSNTEKNYADLESSEVEI